jgi:hypothetical protein
MIKLSIGDTYKNSIGNTITINDIYDNGKSVQLSCPKWTSMYKNDYSDIVDSIKLGRYTNYKSVNATKVEYEVGGTFITDFKNTYQISGIYGDKTNTFCIDGRYKGENKIWNSFDLNFFKYTPPNNTSMNKVWKKEDFLNTKIIVDTPEKSKRFQELIYNLQGKKLSRINGLPTESEYLYIDEDFYMQHGETKKYFNEFRAKEIFYDQIFNNNNQSITTTNENNNSNTNDIPSTNLSGYGRKESSTAISFSKTSCIASSRRLVGNTIQGRTIKTRVGRFEIQFKAVTT